MITQQQIAAEFEAVAAAATAAAAVLREHQLADGKLPTDVEAKFTTALNRLLSAEKLLVRWGDQIKKAIKRGDLR